MEPSSPKPDFDANGKDPERFHVINRFISALAGTFRSFHLYKHDNKALEEILNNLVSRFQGVAHFEKKIKLGITSLSITFENEPMGFQELSRYLASTLRSLKFREIVFSAPIQTRHFFPIFNILSGKDTNEIKIQKLTPFFDDGEEKPIALVPITSHSLILNLADEIIQKRLAPLSVPKDQEQGTGFKQEMALADFSHLSDLYTWICVKAHHLNEPLKVFVRTLVDTAREGFFPFDRFLNVFPLSDKTKAQFTEAYQNRPHPRKRKPNRLAHRFIPITGEPQKTRGNHESALVSTTPEDVQIRERMRTEGSLQSFQKDLELAQLLLGTSGHNRMMGIRLLNRILANKNVVATQEKALKLGILVYTRLQQMTDDARLMSLLSTLRDNLSVAHNLTLVVYPLRNLSIDSDVFDRTSKYIFSLGDAALPSLITLLEAEENREMRKKLILLIQKITSQYGPEFLVELFSKASHFLLRNLIMILGDLKSIDAIEPIAAQIDHSFKIVREEAVRSLIKIDSEKGLPHLSQALDQTKDESSRKELIQYFTMKKDRNFASSFVRIAKEPSLSIDLRKALYKGLSELGGLQAKQFLESLSKNSSFIGRFSAEEKELHNYVKSLARRVSE